MIVIHGYKAAIRCRIKTGWEGEYRGKEGLCYGYINLLECWGIVVWDNNSKPDLYKMSGLQKQTVTWEDMK